MKRVAVLVVFFIFSSLLAQDVEISRGQLWTRLTVAPTINKGFGAYLSVGMRDNFTISKEVNGEEKPIQEQQFWLKEMMAGASWARKIGEKSTFKTLLLYRPQYWYPDNVGGDSYLRHTVMSSNNLFHRFNRVTLHQRLMLWGQFEVDQADRAYDNELILRYMIGPEIALTEKFSLSAKVEPFLKLTADESDLDGTEVFNRFVTWAGFSIKPTKNVKLSLEYVNMQIFPKANVHIKDHYIYAHVIYSPKL